MPVSESDGVDDTVKLSEGLRESESEALMARVVDGLSISETVDVDDRESEGVLL